ncbi:MAG: immunoglobulin domain-containing protein, partial [Saprospiraceae bacterium]|nr:immunoglobulin domain-containing protein [Saprospiraceae bacterium]
MSNLKPNYFWQFLFVIGTLFTTKSYSQNCAIVINNVKHPTSCYASDGSITVTATDQPGNPCERTVKLLKDNVQIAEGQATLSVGNLSSGMYSVIAINGCGCSQVQTKEVFLNGGTSTKLTPYADKGSGFYQAKNVYVCRGGTVKLGTQPLGITGFTITGPNGFTSSSPQGSSYFTLTNVQPSQTGQYTIQYTNGYGCISETAIYLEVGALSVNAGQDQAACFGSSFTLTASGSGQATCKNTCSVGTDSLLVKWTLDQCNAQGATNQDSYTEFIPEFPNTGNCTEVDAGNIYRDKGEHSCTPIIGSYPDDVGMCIPSMESCDPLDYDSDYAIKFSVSLTPSQIGRLSKLTFYEQSPFNWITTNGSTGINNYNTKYLIRVYKNDILIFEENERTTERSWNLETFDFSSIEEFNIYEPSTFRFELRGYCVVENNGVMNGWELNDIRVYGGCCINNNVENPISYIWSNGATTSTIVVTPLETTTYTVSVVDCKGCVSSDEVKTTVYPLPVASITGSGEICFGDSAILTAQGGSSYHWSTGEVASTIEVKPAETTTYFVTVTSTDGCTSVASHQVIVHKLPTPVISGDFDLCIGESTTLSASGGLSYIWSNGSTTNTITITPTSTINISVTTTDNHGCQNATSVTIIVHPLPVPSIIGKSEICYGESTVLEADGGISYLWSTGETTKSIVVNPIINSTYSVTVTSEFGCVESTQKEIVVHALPIVSISGNSEICFGSNLELVATGGISYMWSTGQTSPAITVHPGIETSYSVTA